MIRLQLTQSILCPFRSVSLHGGGEDDDESASRRDNKSVSSALTNASIKSARSKESSKSNEKSEDVAAGKSNKKRGVFVGLTLAVGVAVGVSVGLYYENRKTVTVEAAFLADYDGPFAVGPEKTAEGKKKAEGARRKLAKNKTKTSSKSPKTSKSMPTPAPTVSHTTTVLFAMAILDRFESQINKLQFSAGSDSGAYNCADGKRCDDSLTRVVACFGSTWVSHQ